MAQTQRWQAQSGRCVVRSGILLRDRQCGCAYLDPYLRRRWGRSVRRGSLAPRRRRRPELEDARRDREEVREVLDRNVGPGLLLVDLEANPTRLRRPLKAGVGLIARIRRRAVLAEARPIGLDRMPAFPVFQTVVSGEAIAITATH
jgi:hypothetical protein